MKYILTREILSKAVQEANSLLAVFRIFGMSYSGAATKRVKKLISEYEIDTTHWYSKKKPSIYTGGAGKRLTLNSTINNASLKKWLLENNKLKNECSECKQGPIWNKKKLSLQLDHINGISNDNRLSNLRILCPNCHTQTDTFAGKKMKKPVIKCINCKKEINKLSTRCIPCHNKYKPQKTKIKWPSKKYLLKQICIHGYEAIGRKLGVSGNAIKKRIKNH